MAKRELRIQRELMHFDKETSFPGMTLAPDPNDIHHFTATILGPDSSPYHRGVFHIDITLTDDYPFMPPKMRFTTKIWHPNISSQTGAIGLDILKNNWSPAINLRSALICLQALLSVPEPTEPQDAVVAKQYLTDRAAFTATARRWTEDFALVSSAEYNRKVEDFAIVSSAEYNRKVEDVAMVSSAEYDRKVEEFVMISSTENSRKVQKLIDKSGFRNTLLVIAVYLLLLGIGSLFV